MRILRTLVSALLLLAYTATAAVAGSGPMVLCMGTEGVQVEPAASPCCAGDSRGTEESGPAFDAAEGSCGDCIDTKIPEVDQTLTTAQTPLDVLVPALLVLPAFFADVLTTSNDRVVLPDDPLSLSGPLSTRLVGTVVLRC